MGHRDSLDALEKRKISCPCWGSNPASYSLSLITIQTTLSWFFIYLEDCRMS